MTARMNYLGYFIDEVSTAVHEAGHAVAAIRAGWFFSHIELFEEPNERGVDGTFDWGGSCPLIGPAFARQKWQFSFTSDWPCALGEGVQWRENVIRCALAGAVAVRLLVFDPIYRAYPSNTDIGGLVDAGHYPPETLDWLDNMADDPAMAVSALDAIFAPDLPMVEAFVIENQRAIGDVANELWHRTEGRMDGESWRDLPYDDIRTKTEN